jgi:hypothetical protein
MRAVGTRTRLVFLYLYIPKTTGQRPQVDSTLNSMPVTIPGPSSIVSIVAPARLLPESIMNHIASIL